MEINPPDIGIDVYQKFNTQCKNYKDAVSNMMICVYSVYEVLARHEEEGVVVSYQEISEDLGEILKNLSEISLKMGIPLSDIARANLFKNGITSDKIEEYND